MVMRGANCFRPLLYTRSSTNKFPRMTDPLIPGTLAFRYNGAIYSPHYDDIYHSAVGSLAQAEYVFLKGNALPERWRGQPGFTVFETGFGMGINFLMTWRAWLDDPARAERLHFVSIEKHPLSSEDLRRAYALILDQPPVAALAQRLIDAWPDLVAGSHRLEFEDGNVALTLIFDDAAHALPALDLAVDAFYLDGFAPAKNPELWSPHVFASLARLAKSDASFATYTSSGDVKRALRGAGFEYRKVEGFGWKRAMLVGKYAGLA
jgi:tRNA 5-methylaminomethyl-2-thiouridine biosynthesis bifunctional protein